MDVFISYSRKDYCDSNNNPLNDSVVSKIKETLANNNITFWFDEEGIHASDDFAKKIVTNIRESKIFLYISSINSNTSSWTKKEIACAIHMNKKIIPFRIDKSEYDDSVMFYLADLNYIDYNGKGEQSFDELVSSIIDAIETINNEAHGPEIAQLEEKLKEKRIKQESCKIEITKTTAAKNALIKQYNDELSIISELLDKIDILKYGEVRERKKEAPIETDGAVHNKSNEELQIKCQQLSDKIIELKNQIKEQEKKLLEEDNININGNRRIDPISFKNLYTTKGSITPKEYWKSIKFIAFLGILLIYPAILINMGACSDLEVCGILTLLLLIPITIIPSYLLTIRLQRNGGRKKAGTYILLTIIHILFVFIYVVMGR